MKFIKKYYNSILWVIGILFSIYLYTSGRTIPSILLIEEPVRTTIMNHANDDSLNRISVYYDSTKIEDDLHSLFFYLYNNGNVEIKEKQFREPIKISLTNDVIIQEIRAVKISHPNIGLQIEMIDNHSFYIFFKELFSDDGVTIQVIYEGMKECNLNCTSTIAGMDRVSTKPINKYSYYIFYIIIVLVAISLFRLYFIGLNNKAARETKYYEKQKPLISTKEFTPEEIKEHNRVSWGLKFFLVFAYPIIALIIVFFIFILPLGILDSLLQLNPNWFIPDTLKINF